MNEQEINKAFEQYRKKHKQNTDSKIDLLLAFKAGVEYGDLKNKDARIVELEENYRQLLEDRDDLKNQCTKLESKLLAYLDTNSRK